MKKILIANRGEIAVRVIQTANKCGIKTVAIYHPADRQSLHVQLADTAIELSGVTLAETYLNQARIIEIAQSEQADAIHPGYGFLSENAGFAGACSEAGIQFIGPGVDAIEAMGSKSRAKQIMEAADVPLLPGFHGDNASAEDLHEAALRCGYPVLLKAAAGGGGKGMRIVESDGEFNDALTAAKREAQNAFGDDTMIVEKLLVNARHIEVQVFCDRHGNGVYLFERDCSIQRRHQKVIEEAPAPGLSPDLRKDLGEAAVRAAKAIQYEGAGTVEFLMDSDGNFYFMEMNTRLQVEHPVTEAITGQDLVAWQIDVADGKPLPLKQNELSIEGHAIEVRLYAENPANGFLPSIGRIDRLLWPSEARVDTGVQEGDQITPLFDPMIAKLIVHGADRDSAIDNMSHALDDTHIFGVETNTRLLRTLINHPTFTSATMHTAWLDGAVEEVLSTAEFTQHQEAAIAVLRFEANAQSSSVWQSGESFRLFAKPERNYTLSVEGSCVNVTHSVLHAKALASWSIERFGNQWHAYTTGLETTVSAYLPDREAQGVASDRQVRSPMSGSIIHLAKQDGDAVVLGDSIITLEAMKMEHTLKAQANGILRLNSVSVGDQVRDDQLLATIEDHENER